MVEFRAEMAHRVVMVRLARAATGLRRAATVITDLSVTGRRVVTAHRVEMVPVRVGMVHRNAMVRHHGVMELLDGMVPHHAARVPRTGQGRRVAVRRRRVRVVPRRVPIDDRRAKRILPRVTTIR